MESFDHVAVLAISFDNDDIGVTPLTLQLLEVFRQTYGFHTDNYIIKTRDSNGALLSSKAVERAVFRMLNDWSAMHDGPRNLLIVYYSGHGHTDANLKTLQWR